MRPSNKSRSRNKPGNNGNNGAGGGSGGNNNQRRSLGNIINRVFESAGPDGKVRGTPQQIIDKYQALARDAQVSGDRVAAESFLQHAEHYSRMLGEAQREQGEPRFTPQRDDSPRVDDPFEPDREPPRDTPRQPPREQAQPQPQPIVAPLPSGSGLVMIDTDEPDYFAGPIETPESKRPRTYEPAPPPVFIPVDPPFVAQPEPMPEPVIAQPVPMPEPVAEVAPVHVEIAPELPLAAEPVAEAAPAKVKRPRTRRKAKVETGEETPAAEPSAES